MENVYSLRYGEEKIFSSFLHASFKISFSQRLVLYLSKHTFCETLRQIRFFTIDFMVYRFYKSVCRNIAEFQWCLETLYIMQIQTYI